MLRVWGISGLSRRCGEEVGGVVLQVPVFPKGCNALLEMLRPLASVQIKTFLCFSACVWGGFPSLLHSASERGIELKKKKGEGGEKSVPFSLLPICCLITSCLSLSLDYNLFISLFGTLPCAVGPLHLARRVTHAPPVERAPAMENPGEISSLRLSLLQKRSFLLSARSCSRGLCWKCLCDGARACASRPRTRVFGVPYLQ